MVDPNLVVPRPGRGRGRPRRAFPNQVVVEVIPDSLSEASRAELRDLLILLLSRVASQHAAKHANVRDSGREEGGVDDTMPPHVG